MTYKVDIRKYRQSNKVNLWKVKRHIILCLTILLSIKTFAQDNETKKMSLVIENYKNKQYSETLRILKTMNQNSAYYIQIEYYDVMSNYQLIKTTSKTDLVFKQITDIKTKANNFISPDAIKKKSTFYNTVRETVNKAFIDLKNNYPATLSEFEKWKKPEPILIVSKQSLNFPANGGSENITVTTNGDMYSISLLPIWCAAVRNSTGFELTCFPNNKTAPREEFFLVKADQKELRINVSQEGMPQTPKSAETKNENTILTLSETHILFPGEGGKEKIKVTTNSPTYSISSLPSWCTVINYKDSFELSCSQNPEPINRSSYFLVKAGDKEVRVNVNQSLLKTPRQTKNLSKIGVGIEGGTIAFYGLRFEYMHKVGLGFFTNIRSSLSNPDTILDGIIEKDKNELVVGPSFRIFNGFNLNLGAGVGFYQSIHRNDYADLLNVDKTYYSTGYGGITLQIGKIGISGGASFIDIINDFYNPEYTAGITYRIK